jgi:hypothetical protein
MRTSAPTRLLGLDALRGLAILLMCLNGLMPALLPNWMYHGYNPHWIATSDSAGLSWTPNPNPWAVSDLPSFTWVDWVFPGFLFAMGAAIPIALGRRRDTGSSLLSTLGTVFSRFIGLVFFAVAVRTLSPHVISKPPDATAYLLSLLGFVLMFAAFTRLPDRVPAGVARGVRWGGVGAIALLILALNSRDGVAPFTWSDGGRWDIIILLLAHTYLFASVAFLLTRRWPWLRLILLLPIMVVAHHQAIDATRYADYRWAGDAFDSLAVYYNAPRDWLDGGWWASLVGFTLPAPFDRLLNVSGLWDFTWYKYLWLVIPGTMIGQTMIRPRPDDDPDTRLSWSRCWGYTLLLGAALFGVFAGLRGYGLPTWSSSPLLMTPVASITLAVPPLIIAMLVALFDRSTPGLIRSLMTWAGVTLILGLALACMPWPDARNDFFEGGISKDPEAKLAYYLVCIGVSTLMLILLTLWIDLRGSGLFNLLVWNGQNPLIAYAAIRNLVGPLLALPLLAPWLPDAATINDFVRGTLLPIDRADPGWGPWKQFAFAMLVLMLLAIFVAHFSRRRVFWRV